MINIRTFATIIVKRPKTVLLVYTIITILVGLQIQNVYMQSDLALYLPSDDPTMQMWNKIDKEFKIGSTIIILINQTDEIYDLRDYEVLREMDDIYRMLYENPISKGKENDIASIRSLAVLIREENAKPGPINIGGGTSNDDIPDDANAIYTYMQRAKIASMNGILYTNDFEHGVIIIQLKENADYNEELAKTKNALEDRGTHYSNMIITGGVAVQEAMRENTFQSLLLVFGLALLFMIINMYFFHRNLKSFIIGFLPLGYSLVLTFGVLGAVHPGLTILTIGAIALLIGLGDDYSVYYSSRFAEEHTTADKIERVERTLRLTGKAVLMCAVATMIGFGSLMTSNMPPMVAFGFVCLLGTAFIFLSATILVPCMCIILDFKHHETSSNWKRFAEFIVGQRKRMFLIGCFFVVMSLLVIPQVKTDVNLYEMAPTGLPEVESLFEYSKAFGGGTNFNALSIETDAQGLKDPDVINAIYNMETKIRTTGASATSIADEIKTTNDLLEDIIKINTTENIYSNVINAVYTIDAQYIKSGVYALSIADEIEKNETLKQSTIKEEIVGLIREIIYETVAKNGLVDKDFSKTIIIVSFPADISVEELDSLVNEINSIASAADIPQNGHVSGLFGQDVVTVEVNKQIMSTQVSSTLTEMLLILAVLTIGFVSFRIGFLSILPVLFVVAWEPGSLVLLNIPLSVINVTVAAIVFSTGIDYGIVIIQRLKEERAKGFSKVDALKKTIETSGWSIVTASSTTMVAMIATFFVNIPMLHQFAIIVILLYITSVVASFCILPTVYASKWFK